LEGSFTDEIIYSLEVVAMFITVAGVKKEAADGISITELIKNEKVESPEYVSVSVNDDFVLREVFDTTKLSDGDIVEFLYFMGGGSNC
jgi:sulfur carrier protein